MTVKKSRSFVIVIFVIIAILVSLIVVVSSMLYLRHRNYVDVNGELYPIGTETFTVNDVSSIKDYSVFNRFPSMRSIDFTGAEMTLSDYDYVAGQLDDRIQILWNVPVGSGYCASTVESLSFDEKTDIVDFTFLKYLPNLKEVSVSGISVSPRLKSILDPVRALPQVMLRCSTSVYDVPFDTDTELLDLNALKLTDLSDLDLAISLFPNLKSVEICSCRLSNETIAALNDKYPDTRVVWLLRIKKYSIRTDAQVFSTLIDGKKLITDKLAEPIFKYCTELRALDMGHNTLHDLKPIVNLKKLHTLILADNCLSDLSPLKELTNLRYVEIQWNWITNVEPLSELPLLTDLKLDRNGKIKNITLLLKCKNLEKLFISECGISDADIRTLKANLPNNCHLSYKKEISDIGFWRMNNKKNANIRKAFFNWQKVKEFPDWQTIIYWERDAYDFSGGQSS